MLQTTAAVRTLPVEAVLQLLEYARKMTNLYAVRLPEDAPALCKKMGLPLPHARRVVEFAAQCIDPHFTRLAMLPSARGVVAALQQAVDKQARTVWGIASLGEMGICSSSGARVAGTWTIFCHTKGSCGVLVSVTTLGFVSQLVRAYVAVYLCSGVCSCASICVSLIVLCEFSRGIGTLSL